MIEDISGLITALRHAGIPIRADDLLRLHHVFSLEPDLGGDPKSGGRRLGVLLRAVLLHEREQFDTFDRVFTSWLHQREQELRFLERKRSSDKSVGIAEDFFTSRKDQGPVRRILTRLSGLRRYLTSLPTIASPIALALLLFIPVLLFFTPIDLGPEERVITTSSSARSAPGEPGDREMGYQPAFMEIDTMPIWTGWPTCILALLALASCLAIHLKLGRRSWLPKPEAMATGPGPTILPPPASPVTIRYLDHNQSETLVWGIDRYLAEELTSRLDVGATVKATAKSGGLIDLIFEQARHHREVWLWVDGAVDDPSPERLALEVQQVLKLYNLPVELAWFRHLPRDLHCGDRTSFMPREVDERRDSAMVAILTDGRRLLRNLEGHRRLKTETLLRYLSHWPRLFFVDFSADGRLEHPLQKRGLKVIPPQRLASVLGGDANSVQKRMAAEHTIRLWAGGCCLSPAPIREEQAMELGRCFGLDIGPWDVTALRRNSGCSTGPLSWSRTDTIERLRRLALAEGGRGGLNPHGRLAAALSFWKGVYDRRIKEVEVGPLRESAGRQRLKLERLLLELWTDDCKTTVPKLYGLYQGGWDKNIAAALSFLAPWDIAQHHHVPLPWEWQSLPDTQRVMLAEMNLAGGLPVAKLRRPGRYRFAFTLCGGLALGMALLAFQHPLSRPPLKLSRIPAGEFVMGSPEGEVGRFDNEGPQHKVKLDEFWIMITEVTNGQYRAYKPNHDLSADDGLPAVNVSWDEARAFCQHYDLYLPTEAEWEYACRAGSTTRYFFGDDESDLVSYAWYVEYSSMKLQPVATRKENPWGLYDMHGNAWEWAADWYGDYKPEAQVNHSGPPNGEYRVVRGGGFVNGAWVLRSAGRVRGEPSGRGRDLGFRCVRAPRRQ